MVWVLKLVIFIVDRVYEIILEDFANFTFLMLDHVALVMQDHLLHFLTVKFV